MLAKKYGGLDAAAQALRYPSVQALKNTIESFEGSSARAKRIESIRRADTPSRPHADTRPIGRGSSSALN